MFEIEKQKDKIIVKVLLKKRLLSKQPKIVVTSRDVKKELEKRYPELNLSLVKNEKASNTSEPYGATWVFKITNLENENNFSKLLRTKKEKASKKTLETIQTATDCEKDLAQDLTSPEKSDTMEATTEDLPLLVQEPTE